MTADIDEGEDGAGVAMPEAGVCRLVTLEIAAFNTCVSAGLMPQARHSGSDVCTFAVAGSKFDGTGFGKLHIVQTQVAAVC